MIKPKKNKKNNTYGKMWPFERTHLSVRFFFLVLPLNYFIGFLVIFSNFDLKAVPLFTLTTLNMAFLTILISSEYLELVLKLKDYQMISRPR